MIFCGLKSFSQANFIWSDNYKGKMANEWVIISLSQFSAPPFPHVACERLTSETITKLGSWVTCDSSDLRALESLTPNTFRRPLSVNQSPVWRVMDELMPVVSQNSKPPPATFPPERSSPLCGRNHCRLAQTAVLSMQELCVAPLNCCLSPPFFFAGWACAWVGGLNTLASCPSHRVFSSYSFIAWQNDVCVLREGWVWKSLSLQPLTALECVSGRQLWLTGPVISVHMMSSSVFFFMHETLRAA